MTVEILYLYKPRTTSRSDDAPPPLVKRLEALAGSRWRSGSRLVDAAAPSYRSGNLFVVTNLKLDSSSPYSLLDVWLVPEYLVTYQTLFLEGKIH
ncbi:hypothetical protein S83_031883 [Arachis hypogaea]